MTPELLHYELFLYCSYFSITLSEKNRKFLKHKIQPQVRDWFILIFISVTRKFMNRNLPELL
jgi:hypothetical protein